MKKWRKIWDNNAYMLQLIKAGAPYFITLTLFMSLNQVLNVFATTWYSKFIFDSLLGGKPYSHVLYFILAFFVVQIITGFTDPWYREKKAPIEREKIKFSIRTKLFKKTKELDFACYEDAKFYDKYTRALAQADQRAEGVIATLTQFANALVSLLSVLTIVIILDPALIIVAIVGTVLMTLINKGLAKLRYSLDTQRTPIDREAGYIHRIFYEPQYAKDIKVEAVSDYFLKQYERSNKSLITVLKKITSKIVKMNGLYSVVNYSVGVVMTIYITYKVFNHTLTVGDYSALLTSTYFITWRLSELFGLLPSLYENSMFIENLRTIMDYKPSIECTDGIVLKKDEPILIELKDISFTYPGAESRTIDHMSMIIRPNEKIALVGRNGAGKTTVIKLLLRLYDVSEGAILINNINIKEYNVASIRGCIATVFQDFQLYATSVANVLLGREYTDDDLPSVTKALKNAGLYDRIMLLPKTIHTNISKEFDSEGVSLSGGELQKLLLAKAFIKNAPMMIMDEPNSALDPLSEYEMNNNMIDIAKDKAVILITHRLSTVKMADHIYFLENGDVVESGSHKDMLALGGKYKAMYDIQARSYLSDSI